MKYCIVILSAYYAMKYLLWHTLTFELSTDAENGYNDASYSTMDDPSKPAKTSHHSLVGGACRLRRWRAGKVHSDGGLQLHAQHYCCFSFYQPRRIESAGLVNATWNWILTVWVVSSTALLIICTLQFRLIQFSTQITQFCDVFCIIYSLLRMRTASSC